ncbi:MAG: hypothetical protein AAF602_11845 [Myxococcota bacterium]
MTRGVCLASTLLLLTACPADEIVELENVGVACLGSHEGGVADIDEDAASTIFVTLDSCASGCASEIETSCTATLDGTTIAVTADASMMLPGGNASCPLVCTFVQAECDTEALPAGTYTLEYAGQSTTLEVPSMDSDVCTAMPL